MQKYIDKSKKIFSKTTGPISTKIGRHHPWLKRSQVCTNEGTRPIRRGNNYEKGKIHRHH